jgi:hypothetical protein
MDLDEMIETKVDLLLNQALNTICAVRLPDFHPENISLSLSSKWSNT